MDHEHNQGSMSHTDAHEHMHHEHHGEENHANHDAHHGHDPAMFKHKFWLSLLLTMPVLLYSHTVQSLLHFTVPRFTGSAWLPAIAGIVIFIYGGIVFLKGAVTELKCRTPGMMTLISLAISVAFAYSLAVTFKFVEGMDFWWELATLITIMLLGHWLEMASVMGAQGALKELASLLPDKAELVTEHGSKMVAPSELKIDDVVLVRPGGAIAADGDVVEGESDVNESMLTGESLPLRKIVGSEVVGGSINGSGALKVRVIRIGEQTALAGIMKLVSDAQVSKSRAQMIADRAASYLTYVALGAAFVTALAWSLFSDRSAGFVLERVVTVLVIACPHALGLAVPLVTAISTTRAAKNGLLVRNRLALEAVRNIDMVLFDKTGTLTRGEHGVTDVWSVKGLTTDNIVHVAASLEQQSEHIVGRGILRYANERKISLDKPTDFQSLPGVGVQAKLDGKVCRAVSYKYLDEHNLAVPEAFAKKAAQAAKDGKTEVYIMRDNQIIGAMALADLVRENVKDVILRLRSIGIETAMITGDSRAVAQYVAKDLGLQTYFAEVRPEDKANKVMELQRDGNRVAMVGDGINDAPALVRADIGIAIGAGTDVAVESADVVLISSDPVSIITMIALSKATYRKMVQNLAWAAGYNVLAIPLAAGVTAGLGFVLSPAIGAVLMSLSTIVVAVNAQLLRREHL